MKIADFADDDALLQQLLEGVEGWLPLPEAGFLRDLAKGAQNDIVEIGCYRGRSTIALCCGAAESGLIVHSVDPHRAVTGFYGGKFGPQDREFYYRNLLASGMAQRAALINMTSEQAGRSWQQPIGLLFIDGDHAYESVRRDIAIWGSHVVPSGIVAFDDASDPTGGPSKVLHELVDSGEYRSHAVVGKVHSLQKRSLLCPSTTGKPTD